MPPQTPADRRQEAQKVFALDRTNAAYGATAIMHSATAPWEKALLLQVRHCLQLACLPELVGSRLVPRWGEQLLPSLDLHFDVRAESDELLIKHGAHWDSAVLSQFMLGVAGDAELVGLRLVLAPIALGAGNRLVVFTWLCLRVRLVF